MDPNALISSTTSLNKISRSFTGLSTGIAKSSFLTRNIAKNINTENRNKRKLISSDASFFRSRREGILRRKREDAVEAQGLQGALKQRGKVIKDTGKGFLGRILSFLGIVLIGFVASRLPAILKAVTGLVRRIQQAVGILTGFINGVVGIFTGMGEKLTEIVGMFSGFDFSGAQEKSKESLTKVNEDLNKLNRGFIDSVNTYKDDSELDEAISKINEKRKERPWWDPLGVFEEEEVEEKTDEEKYNESKSDDDKPWGELSDDEKKDFLKKNAKIEYSKVPEGVLTMNQGGELKKGESAIVGDDAKGKGKDRELFVPNQDGIIFPNNITEKLLEASSFLESNKLKSSLKSTADEFDPTNMMKGFGGILGTLKTVKDPSKGILNFGEELKESLNSQMSEAVGSNESQSLIESLKGISESLKPEMESVANELKEVIDTPEMQETFANVKKSMQGVLKEITPKRKGATIMMPMPQGGQSQSKSSPQGSAGTPTSISGGGGGVNIKEYHKHLTTLITAYT